MDKGRGKNAFTRAQQSKFCKKTQAQHNDFRYKTQDQHKGFYLF